MADLETLLARVWSPETRVLAEEAARCYNAGVFRSCIASTWTAVTADIIGKLLVLADDGDPQAVVFRETLRSAQSQGPSREGVRAMQAIEAGLLVNATEFELIDVIDQRELDRLREDRNLCVHPSLRASGEAYAPRPEAARAHLGAALSILLTHPPTQGAKAVEAFQNYTCDPSFVPEIAHIQTVFYDRVRTTARGNIAKLAAKHALREIDPGGRLHPVEYANRAAVVLRAFAERDRSLVESALASQRDLFQHADGEIQRRAVARLGDQDYFWTIVNDPLAGRLQQLLVALSIPDGAWDPLPVEIAECLAVVRSEYARDRMPQLEQRFTGLSELHRMNVVAMAPAPYFVPAIVEFLRKAWNFRTGEQVGQILLQHAAFLSLDELRAALTAWTDNDQCRMASQMPELAASLYRATTHLGVAQPAVFIAFLAKVQSLSAEGDTYYRYPALETALRAAGHDPEPTPATT
ncbi:hypothetical protein [Nocardia sp. 852002-20019_SCH5090214]|uniref:hypothetical protein n=1 Tax=Nocardia sp. 852002-20019_SCH5090214 TaxID=1834087 RepID=UPI000AB54E9D|nr:hypothetical protein [Nocardia sp. 852002-20019_SCH5090214]